LASACAVSPEWVIRHVEDGILVRPGATVVEWRFTTRDLARVRHIYTTERDFDAAPELAGLVADLLDEVEQLRARLRRAGLA
jgi:chaperone modulatory protein CbpM